MLSDPHDRFFKSSFGQIALVRDLLRGFLPEPVRKALDIDSLEFVPTEWVGPFFEKTHLDLALSGRLLGASGGSVRIYVLVEHKSRPDPGLFLQLLRYMVALWSEDEGAGRPLTPILPFVLHQGEETADSRRFFEHTGAPEVLRPYALDFAPLFLDLGSLDDGEIRGQASRLETVAALLAMKHILRRPLEGMVALFEPIGEGLSDSALALVLRYLVVYYKIEGRERFVRLVRDLHAEERMPTFIEELEEEAMKRGLKQGLEKGLEQGLVKGLEKGLEQDIRKLLRKGILSAEEIADALEVDLSKVLGIQREIAR